MLRVLGVQVLALCRKVNKTRIVEMDPYETMIDFHYRKDRNPVAALKADFSKQTLVVGKATRLNLYITESDSSIIVDLVNRVPQIKRCAGHAKRNIYLRTLRARELLKLSSTSTSGSRIPPNNRISL